MSAKLVLGLVIVAAALCFCVTGAVREFGWRSTAMMFAKISAMMVAVLFVGWLLGTGVAETWP